MTAYFDNASTTFPKPKCVYDFMDSFYRERGGNAGRGSHALSLSAGKLIAETRTRLKKILHCQNKEIVFAPTATIALNMILQGLLASATPSNRNRNADGERSRTVYISPFEHNAVTRVLHHFEQTGSIKVNVLPIQSNLSYDLAEIESLFKKEEPDLLVMSHASNVVGLVQPAEKLCALAKKFGCVTVLDMAQTAGLVDLNVGLETIDFAVFAGHKTLYGPTGISGFAMKSGFDLPPVLFGGTGFESANQEMPRDVPQRYEMGTLNISGIAGLYAATEWILETGIDEIWTREQEHRKRLLEILGKYDFVKVVGSTTLTNHEEFQHVGIVSCLIEGLPSDTAASVFSERNIAVRSGLQCAPLAHKTLGTFPAGTVRFSTGYFTGEEDFGELEMAMEYLKENL